MIPYLKAIVAFHKTWETLRDQLFLKKVLMFLRNPLRNISKGERVAFFDKLKEDPKEAQKLSGSLVLLLDKMDDMDKAEMLAKIFEPYVKGKIPFECFRRLASAIDLGFLEDLQALASAPKNPKGFIFPFLPNLIRTGPCRNKPHCRAGLRWMGSKRRHTATPDKSTWENLYRLHDGRFQLFR